MKIYFFIILISLGIVSCVTQKEFNEVLEKDTIVELKAFINQHPKSKFVPQAQKAIDSLVEDNDWAIAELGDTIPSYQKYLENHKKDLHSERAKNRISYLKEKYALTDCNENPKVDCYENFLIEYPNSRNKNHAQYQIDFLNEQKEFEYYKEINTIEGFETLMAEYPEALSYYPDKLLAYINELQIAKDIYTEVLKENQPETFQTFIELYSYSNYADSAQTILDVKEQQDWSKIKNSKNLNKLRDFLDKYPKGKHYSAINDRYVELKIKKIYEGRHLPMPEMITEENTTDLLSYPEIDTYNNTDVNITITYNGPTNVFVEMKPREKKIIILKPGNYKISAEAENVIPFFGTRELNLGQNYSREWYIRTTRY